MSHGKTNWKDVGIFVFAVLIAVFFVAVGLGKLIRPETHIQSFERWGYPGWFVFFTGVVEFLGGGFLVFRGFRLWGVLVLAMTMIGAAVTHLMAGEIAAVPIPLFLLAILCILGFLSWRGSGRLS